MFATTLANKAGVSPDTVRYYTRIEMLKPDRNPDNGYRVYKKADVRRLRFILAARSLGFTLKDIKGIFSDAEQGESPCPRVRSLLELRMADAERRLRELNELHAKMETALASWSHLPDSHPTGDSVCTLIESINA